MLICHAFPQSEKDKDDHDWSLAGMAYPNLQELSSFISRQHLEYVTQPAATTADPERLQGKQLVAYNIVCDHFKMQDRATPLRLIISGTAGTGKSYLIRCLKLLLAGQLCVTAPTGVAAFNVDGYNLHSLLRLPVKGDFKQLEGNRLQTIQQFMTSIRYLIIDEMSMVGGRYLDKTSGFVKHSLTGMYLLQCKIHYEYCSILNIN